MVRSASAVRVLRRVPTESALATERTLRRLMDENRRLRRELRELRKLERGAHQDPLTGLPNHRLFQQRLREELSRASRDPGDGSNARMTGSILVVSLCGFDAANAALGPGRLALGSSAGDEGMREMARVLRDELRSADVCCRTGDAELMLLLPETDAAGARVVLQRLQAAVFRLGARKDRAMALGAGAASWPADGGTVAALMEVAEGALRAEQRRLRARGRRPPVGRRGPALALVKR
jgi:diguanylate cyclase (GGDEF)-like protein